VATSTTEVFCIRRRAVYWKWADVSDCSNLLYVPPKRRQNLYHATRRHIKQHGTLQP